MRYVTGQIKEPARIPVQIKVLNNANATDTFNQFLKSATHLQQKIIHQKAEEDISNGGICPVGSFTTKKLPLLKLS